MAQNRLKSPVVWASVLAQVVTIMITLGLVDFKMGDSINQIAAGVLQLLVIFGVLNNPTDEGHFWGKGARLNRG